MGRGLLRLRRLGGRAVGRSEACRLFRISHSDEVDVGSAQRFVNSSLAPVILFRRCLESVADILKGIRNRGFTQSRWEALLRYWYAVCRHGPCGPSCSLHPWDEWVSPDLHGFYKLVFDALDILNDFTGQVVVNRREAGVRRWTNWLREDLGSRPYAWLRPDFVPPSPFLVIMDPLTEAFLGYWWSLIFLMLSVVKPGCLFFCRSGHPVVSVYQFLHLVGHLLPQEPSLELPRITERELQEVAPPESTAGGLDGWAWN